MTITESCGSYKRNVPALSSVTSHKATLHASAQLEPTQERTANCRPGVRAVACAVRHLSNATGSEFGFGHTQSGLTHLTDSPEERQCSCRPNHLGRDVAKIGPGLQAMPAALSSPWSALPQNEYPRSAQNLS